MHTGIPTAAIPSTAEKARLDSGYGVPSASMNSTLCHLGVTAMDSKLEAREAVNSTLSMAKDR
jgi:hypothetical protein